MNKQEALFSYLSAQLSLDKEEAQKIAGLFSFVHFEAGKEIIRLGERSDSMYLVLKGLVRAFYIDENGSHTMTGECRGSIGYEMRGTNGFGYDPVFMVGEKSMAELTAEEKNAISHRGAALRELYKYLKERFGE